MPRLIVVFDTNVYRAKGPNEFGELRVLERQHSVLGYANYGTVVELLSHLATPETRDGGSALAASRRLVEHCTEFDGSTRVVRFVASPLGQVTRFLFGRPPITEEDADGFGILLGRCGEDPEFLKESRALLQELAADSASKRSAYVDRLWNSVVKTAAPGAQSWRDVTQSTELRDAILRGVRAKEGHLILAGGIVQNAAEALGLEVRPEDEQSLADAILDNFAIMIEYRNLIIEQVLADGPDMTNRKRANGVFDQVVCGATSASARIRGCPVVVVTDDDDILEAARRADLRQEVISPPEYDTLLRQDRAVFALRVAEILRRQQDRAARARPTV